MNVGIMSGRLSPIINDEIQAFSSNHWKEEFQSANELGFTTIEWVFDLNPNPIMSISGIKEMKELSTKFNISLNSVCCDYFMKRPLFGVSPENLEKNTSVLKDLISSCSYLGINLIEIPLVDETSLKNHDQKSQFIETINKIIPILEDEMKIVLETDLPPTEFIQFINNFDNSKILANYDTGNSASLGYEVVDEFNAIGEKIANIHIKDRLYHGMTVSLGTGDTDFDNFFSELSKINYQGDLIIQGARNDLNENPIETCNKYINFVKQYLDKYSIV